MSRRLAIALALLNLADLALAPPPKVLLCHVLSDPPKTMEVPPAVVDKHLAHGDYLGPCAEEYSEPEGESVGIPMLWLLTRGDWHCILISDTHPSVERQNQLCFPHLDPHWQADNAPCAAPVFDVGDRRGRWLCDHLTPWRMDLVDLLGR